MQQILAAESLLQSAHKTTRKQYNHSSHLKSATLSDNCAARSFMKWLQRCSGRSYRVCRVLSHTWHCIPVSPVLKCREDGERGPVLTVPPPETVQGGEKDVSSHHCSRPSLSMSLLASIKDGCFLFFPSESGKTKCWIIFPLVIQDKMNRPFWRILSLVRQLFSLHTDLNRSSACWAEMDPW